MIEKLQPVAIPFVLLRQETAKAHMMQVEVDFERSSWSPSDQSGTGVIDQDFIIDVYDIENIGSYTRGKYIMVRNAGPGFSVNGLVNDVRGHAFANGIRGSFQDLLSVSVSIDEGNVKHQQSIPTSGKHATSFSQSIGFGVGISGDRSGAGASASADVSFSATTVRDVFEVEADLFGHNGQTFNWKMVNIDTGIYDVKKPYTLADDRYGGLHRPYSLATSLFPTHFEVLYKTSRSNNGIIHINLKADQRLTTVQTHTYWFWQNIKYYWGLGK